jgi:hypothetical protein
MYRIQNMFRKVPDDMWEAAVTYLYVCKYRKVILLEVHVVNVQKVRLTALQTELKLLFLFYKKR